MRAVRCRSPPLLALTRRFLGVSVLLAISLGWLILWGSYSVDLSLLRGWRHKVCDLAVVIESGAAMCQGCWGEPSLGDPSSLLPLPTHQLPLSTFALPFPCTLQLQMQMLSRAMWVIIMSEALGTLTELQV